MCTTNSYSWQTNTEWIYRPPPEQIVSLKNISQKPTHKTEALAIDSLDHNIIGEFDETSLHQEGIISEVNHRPDEY